MRILFVVHGFPPYNMGGTELCTYYLAKELSSRHEVAIFYRRSDLTQEEYALTEGCLDGLRVISVNNTWRRVTDFSMTYRNEAIAARLAEALDQIQPDVVHIQHLTCLSTSLIARCDERGIPIVMTLHDYWLLCQRGQLLQGDLSLCSGPDDDRCARCLAPQIHSLAPAVQRAPFLSTTLARVGNAWWSRGGRALSRTWARLQARWQPDQAVTAIRQRRFHVAEMLDKVDLFLAPSHFLRDTFLRFGLLAEKIRYSDNGMNLKLFAEFQRTPSDRLRFGFTGTLIPSKGVHVLVNAFNSIDPARASLHIWGMDLPYEGYEHYGHEVRQLATNPNIHFMGLYANTDVARVLAEIDVLVVPSIWYENSPLTIHEAFLSRTPVVAANLGGMAEYVRHMYNGLLFRPRDPADLRTQILRLIENPTLVEALRANIGSIKSIAENAAEVETIYQQLGRRRMTGGISVLRSLTNRAATTGAELAEERQNQGLYQKLHWMESPLIAGPYINRQISGDPADNWMIWVKKVLVPNKLGRGLSLGCGEGCLERHTTSLGICEAFDAFDISAQAIAIARAKAAREGFAHIHYEVRDIDKIQLPPEHYDIAFASSALHHIARLEHVLDEVHKALKPGCFFIANEFVGPSRFQWTDKQLQIINDLLALLPPRYRADLRRPGHIKSRVDRPTVMQMLLSDPSEAVRSAEIVPLIRQRFEIVQQTDFGGTILHMLLSHIVGNFDPESEADVTIVRLLCYLEKTLITEGALPSDFALIVAQKRAAPAAGGGTL